MKNIQYVAIARVGFCAALLINIILSSAASQVDPAKSRRYIAKASRPAKSIKLRTTFVYQPKNDAMNVSFMCINIHQGVTHWEMDVGDPYKYINSIHSDSETRGLSISICSQQQYIDVLDQSLYQFTARYPQARVDIMLVGAYTVRPLWREILTAMRLAEAHLPGKKITIYDPANDNLNAMPEATEDAPYQALQNSPVVAATVRIFHKHGFRVVHVGVGDEFDFKESLNGHTWREISTLPDAGISIPGVVEFDIQ